MRKFRLISMMLIAAMLITNLPYFNKADKVYASTALQTSSGETEPKIVGELTEKREQNAKFFLLDNGTYEEDIYSQTVHYYQDGQWKDIDNTLVSNTDDDGNPALSNKQNDFSFKIAKKADANKLVDIKKDSYEISWGIDGANAEDVQEKTIDKAAIEKSTEKIADAKLAKQDDIKDKKAAKEILMQNENKTMCQNVNSSVNIFNIFTNTDLQYNLNGDQIKENIIIKQPTDKNDYTFIMKTKNLNAVLQKDNSVIFYDESYSKTPVFKLNAPYMYDTSHEQSNNIKVNLSQEGDNVTMSYIPDKDWMNSADRRYPITIDPSVLTNIDVNTIQDTFVGSSIPSTDEHLNMYLEAGYGSITGVNRAYIKFSPLPSIDNQNTIIKATLGLDCHYTTGAVIDVHKVDGNWDSNSLRWGNQPSYNSLADDYQKVSGAGYYYWDITNIARQWYTDAENYGLVLTSHNESSGYTEFWSSDTNESRPCASITYVNNLGLEGQWTYHSQSIGRGGTGYINDNNGNLVFVHEDITMTGNRLPISLKHVYNSMDSRTAQSTTDTKFGPGWRLNISQKIVPVTISGTKYYQYTNDTGDKRYFFLYGGCWVDELDHSTTLTINSDSSYTIKDKKNNTLTFTPYGYLHIIKDSNGNHTDIYYSGAKISYIIDITGRKVTFNINQYGYLVGMTDVSNSRTFSFAYSGAKLSRITYPDNHYTVYTYDSNNNMATAVNYDSTAMTYYYYSKTPYRVKSVLESNGATLGQKLTYVYGNNTSTISDINSSGAVRNTVIYQFNNLGETISEKDNNGDASYYKFDDLNNQTKLSLKSKMQKTTVNYLLNSNTEKVDSDWSLVSWMTDSDSTGSFSTDTAYLGTTSLKVNKTTTYSRDFYRQQVILKKGQTYTLSGYVKTSNVTGAAATGAGVFAYYNTISNDTIKFQPNFLLGTNDWSRMEVKFTVGSDAVSPANDSTSAVVYVGAGLVESVGTVYFDCLQLEDGPIANRYNLVENSDFRYTSVGMPVYWSTQNCNSGDTEAFVDGRNTFKINGDSATSKNIYQVFNVSGAKGDAFVFGGWAKAHSVPPGSGRFFSLDICFDLTDGTRQYKVLSFNTDCDDWQYASDVAIANNNYYAVKIFALYYQNENTAYFDNVQVYKEQFGESYTYDSNGNVVSTADLAKNNSTFQYDSNNNLIKAVNPKGGSYSYSYDPSHNITSATTAENVVYSFTYDSYGNPVTGKVGNSTIFMNGSADYTSNRNYITSVTDSEGLSTKYNYNTNNGTLTSVTDKRNNTVSNTYDPNLDYLKTTSAAVDGNTATNAYDYENDRIKTITHNTAGQDVMYNFGYDALGNNTTVSVGNQNLVTNTYEPRTSLLLSSTYGNGQTSSIQYDNQERVIAKSHNGTAGQFKYTYDNSGNLGYMEDYVNGKASNIPLIFRYIYDNANRLVTEQDSNGNSISYSYDKNNNTSIVSDTVSGKKYDTSYGYDKDNKLTSVFYDRNTITLNYDILGRLTTRNINTGSANYSTTYGYLPGANGSTTTRVGTITNNNNTTAYSYDSNGNISKITQNGQAISYNYNELNELIREDNQVLNKTITYSYDAGGNILNKVEYPYTTGTLGTAASTINYSYEDPNWKDKLTSYNGEILPYDAIGNLLGYNGWNLTWQEGRQLSGMSGNGNTISYKYNDSGIRTSKTVNGVTTKYNLVGDKVNYENNGTDKIYYTYDSSDNLVSMSLSGADSYGRNLYDYAGSHTPIQLSGTNTAAEKFTASNLFDKVSVSCPSWSNNIGNLTLSLYKWNTDYNTTISGSPITSREFDNFTDNQWLELSFEQQSAGDYLWVLSNPTEKVGVWKFNNSNNGGTAYLNGAVVSGDYESKISYKTDEYYYIRNAQDDIVGLIDMNGTQVVSYTYDSWGKLISIDGSLKDSVGVKNPYRYRGYRYDTETGLYYLNSRYYNPEWGRFINADTLVGQTGKLLSHNMFIYSMNNPINMTDDAGYWPSRKTFGCIVGAVAVVAVLAVAAPLVLPVIVGAAVGAGFSAGINYCDQRANGTGEIDGDQIIQAACFGAMSGALGGSSLGLGFQMGLNGAIGGTSTFIENPDAELGEYGVNIIGSVLAAGMSGAGAQNPENYEFHVLPRIARNVTLKAAIKGVANSSLVPAVIVAGKYTTRHYSNWYHRYNSMSY